jgi:hypothetical protein
LGPGPSWPGLGFWGLANLAPPQAAALALPLAIAFGALGEGQGCIPPPYINGAPREERNTQFHEPSSTWPPSSTSLAASHLHLPSSIPRGLPKGWVGGRSHHRCTPSCCGVSGSHPKPSTSAILVGSGIPGVIVITVRVRVRGGAAHVAAELLFQDLHDLEVVYIVFIANACAGA